MTKRDTDLALADVDGLTRVILRPPAIQGPVTAALGVEPVWEEAQAWTGRILAGRAHGWGWAPTVDLPQALAEIDEGLRI